jgi:hypothetical protein
MVFLYYLLGCINDGASSNRNDIDSDNNNNFSSRR